VPSPFGNRRGRAGGDGKARRRILALVVALGALGTIGWLLFRDAATSSPKSARAGHALQLPNPPPSSTHPPQTSSKRTGKPAKIARTVPTMSRLPPAVGLRIVRLVDTRRVIHDSNGATGARTLITLVGYPAQGPRGAVDLPGAPFAPTSTGFPLIVFGHGFAVTPTPYARLLVAWARAGYIVAAPVFPLENANAPGGPHEADLVNQPADMSFVISSLLAARDPGTTGFAGMIDPQGIAVAGQSDGGDTALATAYDPSVQDTRVAAAVILSGAEDPFAPAFAFGRIGPALLATQGTADTVNPPSMTNAFYSIAPSPKYLLELLGASHQPPYTQPGPQLATVERVTIAFLNAYLKIDARDRQRLQSPSLAGPDAVLQSSPYSSPSSASPGTVTGKDAAGFNIGVGCSDDQSSSLPGCNDSPSYNPDGTRQHP
jgi:dienelactone hydrolase